MEVLCSLTHKNRAIVTCLALLLAALGTQQLKSQAFDFGSDDRAAVVFATIDVNCTVDIYLAGFSFNGQGVYDPSIIPSSANLIASDSSSWNAGCYKPGASATFKGEVKQVMDSIGCGRYKVVISAPGSGYAPDTFYLDLTDMNWLADSANPDGQHSLIFFISAPDSLNDPLLVEAWISENDNSTIYQYLSSVQKEAQIRYWLAVRADPAASSYSRNRDGFELPPGSYPEASVGDATLDVNTNVTGNVTVPSRRTFRVDTDVDGDLVGGQVTMLKFNNGVSFSVYGGLTHRQSQGSVLWTRRDSTANWAGLILQKIDSVQIRESWRGRVVTTDAAVPAQETPLRFMLHAPYPNPVRNTAVISFFLGGDSEVKLHIYDAMGREVARLADAGFTRGPHLLRFDASPLPAGVYRIVMRTGERLLSRSLVVIK